MRPTAADDTPRLDGLTSLLDLAAEALWICDLHGDLRYVNAYAARLLELPVETLRGQNVVTLGLCGNGLPWGRFLEALHAAQDISRPAALRLPSGKVVEVVIRVRLVTLDGVALIQGACVNVSERAQPSAQRAEQAELDLFARGVANRLLRCADDDLINVMRQILCELGPLIGACFVGIMRRDERDGTTEHVATWARSEDRQLPIPPVIPDAHLPMPLGFPEERVIIARPNSDDRRAPFTPPEMGVVAVVLVDQAQILGYLGLFWDDEDRFWRQLHHMRGVARDLGDLLAQALSRRQLRAALLARESERTALMMNLPGVAYRCRWEPSFPLDALSENAALVFGEDRERVLGAPLTPLIHPEDAPRVIHEAHEAAAQGRRCHHTFRVRQPDGTYRWFNDFGVIQRDAAGEPTHVDGILLDASEQKAIEHERDIFFNSAPDPMVILDDHELVQRWNAAWEREFGYNSADMVGQRFERFCHPDDLAPLRAEAMRQLRESGRAHGLEARFVTRSGEWRWLLWSGFLVNRSRRLLFAVARDITERRTLEEERRRHAERQIGRAHV